MGNAYSTSFPREDTLALSGQKIGKGAYGEVFQGTLGPERRPVAVKKVHDILVDAARENRQTLEHVIEKFRRECELLKAAKHPNVVEFIGVFNQGEGEESALLVMELMDQTLEQFLQDNMGTLKKQIAIGLQIATGLLFLHQHDPQILHRDLTAKNVLVNKDGSIAKISDFGQAKFRPTSVQYLTTRQPGTILYMPPEALVDKPHFTDKGDVFSFGVLLLQITIPESPSVRWVIVKGQPEVERRAADLAKLPDDHPLRSIILQCLQDDPSKRPSCSEVLQYLLFESKELWKELCSFNIFQTGQLLENQPTLHSVRLTELPIATSGATAVIISRNVYICGGACGDFASEQEVQVYNMDKSLWTKLPPAPQHRCEAFAIDNKLILIGGREASSRTFTNMVSTWSGQSWEKDIPAMPSKRARPSVMTYGTYVFVAGGLAEDEQTLLTSIDVLDTITWQWQTPSNLQLPCPMYAMQMTVCASHIYVASARTTYDTTTSTGTSSNSVWQLPVSTLVNVLENKEGSPLLWAETAPTPFYRSSLLQHAAHPLAIGGRDNSFKPTPNIAVYNPHSDKWSTVGQLLEPRIACTLVSLSRGSLFVCGGCSTRTPHSTLLNSVELVHMA